MSVNRIVGIVLLVIGVILLVFGVLKKEHVMEAKKPVVTQEACNRCGTNRGDQETQEVATSSGEMHMSHHHGVKAKWAIIGGVLLIVVGGGLVIFSGKKRRKR